MTNVTSPTPAAVVSRRELVTWLASDLRRSVEIGLEVDQLSGLVDDLIELSRCHDDARAPTIVAAGLSEESHLRGVFELAYRHMDVADAAVA